MSEILFVDGYNIINSWPMLAELAKDSLENARFKLLEYVSNYQGYKQNKVIVVFDAHFVPSSLKQYNHDDVEVIFTKEGQSADNYIERAVREIGRLNRVIVATSDYLEQTMILGGGATRMSARELIEELEKQNNLIHELNIKNNAKRNDIEASINPVIKYHLDKLRGKE